MTVAFDLDRVPPVELGTRMRIAREWRSLEQKELADELGISRASVSSYENSHTRPSKLVVNAWAAFCDVDVEWLKNGWAPWGSNPRPADYKGGVLPPNVMRLEGARTHDPRIKVAA